MNFFTDTNYSSSIRHVYSIFIILLLISTSNIFAQAPDKGLSLPGEPIFKENVVDKKLTINLYNIDESDKFPTMINLDTLVANQPAGIRDGYVLLSDMILPISAFQSTTRATYTPVVWSNGTIYYDFAGDVTQENRNLIRAAMDEWEAISGATFIVRSNQSDYVHIKNGSGNWSHVGKIGGEQELTVADWGSSWVLLHELGHVLGLYHEHQRPDRDDYIDIQWENVASCCLVSFSIVSGVMLHGSYDFSSVMHYFDTAYSQNGQKTMLAKSGYEQFQSIMGRTNALSSGDASIAEFIYPTNPPTSPDIRMSLAKPSNNEHVSDPFLVRGWAYDQNAGVGNGTGVNRIGVFEGNSCNGNLLISRVQNEDREDVIQAFNLDNSYLTNGFKFNVPITSNNLTFTVCARSSLDNTYYPGPTTTVTRIQEVDIRMALAKPIQNSNSENSILVRGWAYDTNAGVGNGTGVKSIEVFEGNTCSGNKIGFSWQNDNRQDIVDIYNLDDSYLRNGFRFYASTDASGSLDVTVCIRATLDNQFHDSVTRTINIQATPDIKLKVGKPSNGESVNGTFIVGGWGYDQNAGVGNGTGIDQIAIFQGNNCSGNPVYTGQQNVNRQDIVDIYNLDNSYLTNGYSFTIGPVTGSYTFTVCARSSLTNEYETSITRTVNGTAAAPLQKTLRLVVNEDSPDTFAPSVEGVTASKPTTALIPQVPQPAIEIAIDSPAQGEAIVGAFSISGWAFDRNAINDTGIRHLALYQGTVCRGEPLKLVTPNINRDDVVAQFGLDNRYLASGYRFDLRGLIGAFEFTVCAFSNQTNEYEAKITRTITGTMPSQDLNVVANTPVEENNSQQMMTQSPQTIADASSGNPAPQQTTQQALEPAIEMAIDSPAQNEAVVGAFSISGWALDRNANSGTTGIRHLALFQGKVCRGEPLKLTSYRLQRPDVTAQLTLDNRFLMSGYQFDLRGLIGSFEFTVCAFSERTNEYEAKITRIISGSMPSNPPIQDNNSQPVQAPPTPSTDTTTPIPTPTPAPQEIVESAPLIRLSVGAPAEQEIVSNPFTVYGWAYDENAGSGKGTGVQQVVIFAGTECRGDVLVFTRNFIERQDVLAAHGLDPSYLTSGYSMSVDAGTAKALTFTVCARSTETNQFGQGITRSVQIQ